MNYDICTIFKLVKGFWEKRFIQSSVCLILNAISRAKSQLQLGVLEISYHTRSASHRSRAISKLSLRILLWWWLSRYIDMDSKSYTRSKLSWIQAILTIKLYQSICQSQVNFGGPIMDQDMMSTLDRQHICPLWNINSWAIFLLNLHHMNIRWKALVRCKRTYGIVCT